MEEGILKNREYARAEVLDRLKQRDIAFTVFATMFAGLTAVAFGQAGARQVLLAIPYLALAVSLFAAYHDVVVQYLHLYIKRVRESIVRVWMCQLEPAPGLLQQLDSLALFFRASHDVRWSESL